MKKKSTISNYELDLFDLTKIIWSNKLVIMLITFVFILIAIANEMLLTKTKNNYNMNSLIMNIKFAKNLEINKFESIYNFMNNNNNNNNDSIHFNKFIYQNFEENLRTNFSEFIKIQKNNEPMQEIYEIADSFDISNSKNIEGKYVVKFQLKNDEREVVILFSKFLDNSKAKLINLLVANLQYEIELSKNLEIHKDKFQKEFLLGEKLIAKKLNISDNQIIGSVDRESYFLRGFNSIDEKLNYITNKGYEKYSSLMKEAEVLKKNDPKIIFDYKITSLSQEPAVEKKSFIFNLIVSIIAGLIIGVFFVVSKDLFQPSKLISKK